MVSLPSIIAESRSASGDLRQALKSYANSVALHIWSLRHTNLRDRWIPVALPPLVRPAPEFSKQGLERAASHGQPRSSLRGGARKNSSAFNGGVRCQSHLPE